MASTLAEIRNIRLEKVAKLRKLGIDPYPSKASRTHENKELTDHFSKFEGKTVTVVGRIMAWREMGSLIFAKVQDYTGRIQLILRKGDLEELNVKKQSLGWKELELVDIGDYIEATGKLTKSKTGEKSVEVSTITMITKAIRPLPDKWKGISDIETKLRRRYLDFTVNPDVRDVFARKSVFWRKAREFMLARGFIEVETPILEAVTGGADARPFITRHNALDQDFYLRISSELYQKRLIGGGFEKVFVLGPNFRNEGIDDEHLQEFYQLEYYWAYSDVNDTIALTKELYRYLAEEVYGKTKFTYKGYTFDLSDDWQVIDYIKVIKKRFNIDVFNDSLEKIYKVISDNKVEIEFEKNRNRLVDNLWKIIRREVAGPAALVNAPKFISPLAKSYFSDTDVTQRFQPIIAGTEVGNAYSELNDPIDQYERFREQQEMRNQGDNEAQMLDIDFVEMLEYGMPPCSCIGFSERLFWILEGVTAREGTLFPQTKLHLDETTKEIYGIDIHHLATAQSANKFSDTLNRLRTEITAVQVPKLRSDRLFSIDPALEKKHENVTVGLARIKGIKVRAKDPELEAFKQIVIDNICGVLKAEQIDDIPQIKSYHDMYVRMGVNTKSRKASPEAILRRIVEGKGLYRINTCVDSYNLAVVLTQVSAGAFDFSTFKFPVLLREAEKGETIEIIGGEVKTLKTGEVCYFDQVGAYNIDFNFRDSERTKVTEETTDIWINVDGVGKITREQVADNLSLVIELITRFCGGKVEYAGTLAV